MGRLHLLPLNMWHLDRFFTGSIPQGGGSKSPSPATLFGTLFLDGDQIRISVSLYAVSWTKPMHIDGIADEVDCIQCHRPRSVVVFGSRSSAFKTMHDNLTNCIDKVPNTAIDQQSSSGLRETVHNVWMPPLLRNYFSSSLTFHSI